MLIKVLRFIVLLWSVQLTSAQAAIKIGTVFFYPPFVISPGSGFDMDLARVLCLRLNERCQFITMKYNQLFDALKKGQIDIAIGGIAISQSQNNFIYSLPYMLSKAEFVVLKSNHFKSTADLKGSSVGVIRGKNTGGIFYNFLLETYNNLFQIAQYDDIDDMITALNKGRIAAAFIHRSAATYWIGNSDNNFEQLGSSMFVGGGIGIVAMPLNQPLINRIDQALISMENDNAYMKIYSTYFANE